MIKIKVSRVEQHVIKKTHPIFKIIDDKCFKSKNLYNYANYLIRQEFINNGKWIRDKELDKMLQSHETYTELGSQASQKTLQLLDKNWKSFFNAIKDWKKHPNKYLGRPKIPKYKDKNGRFILMLKNIQCRIENGYLIFSWKPLKGFKFKTNVEDRLIAVRFIPKGSCYVLEIIYEKEVNEINFESQNILGIDLGVNNFATLTNNIGEIPIVINGRGLKSVNQYWNKENSKLKSDLKKRHNKNWSNKLERLTQKRNNKINHFMHCASKWVIDYCKALNIDTIIIGHNKEWKQECSLHKIINQGFVQIPYNRFIDILRYKCEDANIKFIETNESYTSGTSFLDGELPIKDNYDKSRRIFRGMFKSNQGILINSDVNGSYQIIKKVFPKGFTNGIEGVGLHPIRVNLA